MAFNSCDLFGGAIHMDVPEQFYNVSDLRQVPDHQEVFQERDGFDSVIVELLTFQKNLTPDAAARYHLEDYADEPEGLKIWHTEAVHLPKLLHVPAVAILATTPENSSAQCTGIFFLTARLEDYDTDILLITNVMSVSANNATTYDGLFTETADSSFKIGRDIMEQVINTFEITDYSLFIPEGGNE